MLRDRIRNEWMREKLEDASTDDKGRTKL